MQLAVDAEAEDAEALVAPVAPVEQAVAISKPVVAQVVATTVDSAALVAAISFRPENIRSRSHAARVAS